MEMEKEEAKAEGIAIVALSKNRGTLLTLFLWLFPNWLSHEINRSSARGALEQAVMVTAITSADIFTVEQNSKLM